jgi:hypothetical protein
MLVASRQDDLCGLFIDKDISWTGGSTYLHKYAPLFVPGYPLRETSLTRFHFNYAIVGAGYGYVYGKAVIARDGDLELVKVSEVGCIPAPDYPWRLR